LALAGPANEALAILPRLALKTVRAGNTIGAPAINARLVVVLNPVAVRWKSTRFTSAHAIDAICPFSTPLRIETWATRAATILAGLEGRIDHPVHLLRAELRDAVERIARESVAAHFARPIQALNAFAIKANPGARLGAAEPVPHRIVGGLALLLVKVERAMVERTFLAVVVPVARVVVGNDLPRSVAIAPPAVAS
jgi:hypothetical protein